MVCLTHLPCTRQTARAWSDLTTAHNVRAMGFRFKRRGKASDHWHRTEKHAGRAYAFKDAETLIDDFFDEVERVLRERGVSLQVTGEEESGRSK